MLLPSTYLTALLLMIAAMLCAGSWANMQKLTGKWRFELFYYDYALGLVVCAVIAAYTFGSMLPQELTFQDNFLIAAKRQMAYAAGAGVVFNLANLLLVAAISVSGLTVAFPISLGIALVIGAVWDFSLNQQGNMLLLFGGVVLVVVAVIVNAFAYSGYLDAKQLDEKKALEADPRLKKKGPQVPGASRGIVLSVVSGILMSLFYPLIRMSAQGDIGVAPYGLALLFSGGVLFSTLFFVPFFLTFPVNGEPVEARDYLKGSLKTHIWGLLGGIVWMAGTLCSYAASSAPPRAQASPAAAYAFGQGGTLLAALWGLLAWREFKGASVRIKMLLVTMLVLFAAGLAMVSIAPLRPR